MSSRLAPSFLVVLLLAPGVVGTAPAPAAAPSAPSPAALLLARHLLAADASILGQEPGAIDPLAVLSPTQLPPAQGGWDAYLAAFGIAPTRGEAQVLQQFRLAHPRLAQEIEPLLGEVARSQSTRDAVFAAYPEEERDALYAAVAQLLVDPASLTPDQSLALSRLDVQSLVAAGAALARQAQDSPAQLAEAARADKDLGLPPLLRAPGALDDPQRILASLTSAAPVRTDASWEDVLEAYQAVTGVHVPDQAKRLPDDLAAPLASILTAQARMIATQDPDLSHALLATFAEALPQLTRAGYNLSTSPPAEIARLTGAPRAFDPALPAQDAPFAALADLLGAPGEPEPRPFVEGLRLLARATGQAFGEADEARAQAAAAAMGPEVSMAVGTLLAAQAQYLEDLASDAPLVARAREATAAAAPIAARGGPLTLDDIRTLQEGADAYSQWTRAVARDAGAVVRAAETLAGLQPTMGARQGPGPHIPGAGAGDIVYQDPYGSVLVLGTGSTTLTPAMSPQAPILLVDLGGDDRYEAPVAAALTSGHVRAPPRSSDVRMSIAIDLGGNDEYAPAAPRALGIAEGEPGAPGFAVLVDAQGDDRYDVADAGLGMASSGFAMTLDLAGDDNYTLRGRAEGFGRAVARTNRTDFAIALSLDATGNDAYASSFNFPTVQRIKDAPLAVPGARYPEDGEPIVVPWQTVRSPVPAMGENVVVPGAEVQPGQELTPERSFQTADPLRLAAFVDSSGADRYAAACPANLEQACFALPRPTNPMLAFSVGARAYLAFVDGNGEDAYPRKGDPMETATPVGGITADGDNVNVLVADLESPLPAVDGVPDAYDDADGDFIADDLEEDTLGSDPRDPSDPSLATDPARDADGDGWPDLVERVLRFDPADPQDRPVGLPAPIGEDAAGAGSLLDLRDQTGASLVIVGPPGPTTYRRYAAISIDLGMGQDGTAKDEYLNATAWNGLALDLGGDDTYKPAPQEGKVPPALGAAAAARRIGMPKQDVNLVIGGTWHLGSRDMILPAVQASALVDLGGADTYVAGEKGQAYSETTRGLGILLDAAGDDDYAVGAAGQAFAVDDGQAYFLDLEGNDNYSSPTQGVTHDPTGYSRMLVDYQDEGTYADGPVFSNPTNGGWAPIVRAVLTREGVLGGFDNPWRFTALAAVRAAAPGIHVAEPGRPGRVAVFLDAAGDDGYDTGTTALAPSAFDRYQGAAVGPDQRDAYNSVNHSTAIFADLEGEDDYFVVNATTKAKEDLSIQRNDRFRFDPVDGRRGPAGIFYDSDFQSDRDGDGTSDAVEAVGGTDPKSVSLDKVLDLPRLGIAIGDDAATTYLRDYALTIDLGGPDVYKGRVGATSRLWPTSLAIDVGADDDEYRTEAPLDFAQAWPYALGVPEREVVAASAPSTVPVGSVPGASMGHRYSIFVGSAQGAGVLGAGVLVDHGGRNVFRANLAAAGCEECSRGTASAGVAQGASLLGFGALVTDGAANLFEVNLAVDGTRFVPHAAGGVARGIAQGATMFGAALLASRNNAADDTYVIQTAARGTQALDASAGQGYALGIDPAFNVSAHDPRVQGNSVAVLLDAGGRNAFRAGTEAQAYGGAHATALVLLTGLGDDSFAAHASSQAATRGGNATLYNAEGDDAYALDQGAGQAASFGGAALLLDNRGNDNYVARGTSAQAFANGGVASLVDLSGDDAYAAGDQSQAHAKGTNAVALFVDRRGNDAYRVPSSSSTQGATASAERSIAAIFVDAGGDDDYRVAPAGNGKPWREACSNCRGIDDATATGAFQQATQALAEKGVGARVAATGPKVQGSLGEGLIALAASFEATGGHKAPGATYERADFSLGRTPAGHAYPGSDNVARVSWDTTAPGPDGWRRHPDGNHDITAYLYPRAGASREAGTGAAVDAEPFVASRPFSLDNPPVAHPVSLRPLVGAPPGQLLLSVPVERDLEQSACQGCSATPPPLFTARPSEWAPAPLRDKFADAAVPSNACSQAQCQPAVHAEPAGDHVYLRWTAPTMEADSVVGYRVYRVDASGAKVIAFVDAREPSPHAIDKPPASTAKYRVDTLRRGDFVLQQAGDPLVSVTLDGTPAPVAGLAASGAENGVWLAWHSAPGAARYRVDRTPVPEGDTTSVVVDAGPGPIQHHLDKDVPADADHRYVVYALDASGTKASALPSMPAIARKAPGDAIRISLTDAATGNVRWILETPTRLGGNQVHDLVWDPKAAGTPDGKHILRVEAADRPGRVVALPAEVVIDTTPPVTRVDLPGVIGIPLRTSTGIAVPIVVEEHGGAKPARTLVLASVNGRPWTVQDDLDAARFQKAGGAFVANAAVANLLTGDRVRIAALSVDAAGNVEGLVHARAYVATPEDALDDVLASGGADAIPERVVDFTPPTATPERKTQHVMPGRKVELSVAARDDESGLASVEARVGLDTVLLQPSGGRHVGAWVAKAPGQYQAIAVVTDNAGNVGEFALGTIVVDDTLPTVGLAAVSFSGGRSVGRPGEEATLRVEAVDAQTPRGKLNVTAETRNVSSKASIVLPWSGEGDAYLARFPVDNLTAHADAIVRVRVQDLAGNARTTSLTLHINATAVAPQAVEVRNVTASQARLRWNTSVGTLGRVEYGEAAQLGRSTPTSPLGTTHDVLLADLRPATTYYARAVAITDAGVQTSSDLVSLTTASPMDIRWSAPDRGAYAQLPEIRATLRLFDGAPVHGDITAHLQGPRGSPVPIGHARVENGSATLVLDAAALREGAYALHLWAKDARTGHEQGTPSVPVVLDRTAPLILPPDDASSVVRDALRVKALERGSAIDLPNVTWTIGGRPCAAILTDDTLSCALPAGLAARSNAVELRVPDLAGNVANATFTITVDPRPSALQAKLLGPAGQPFLRAGRNATLSVTIADPAIRNVTADLAALGEPKVVLAKSAAGDYSRSVVVPAFARGTIRVPVRAQAADGAAISVVAEAVVDDAAPRILDPRVVVRPGGDAVVEFRTSEPTTATVRVGDRTIRGGDAAAQAHVVAVPAAASRASGIVLEAMDLAGWISSAELPLGAGPDVSAPTPVRAPRVDDLGDGRIEIAWQAAEDDTGVASHLVTRTLRGVVTRHHASGATVWRDIIPVGEGAAYEIVAVDAAGKESAPVRVEAASKPLPRLLDASVSPPRGGPGTYAYRIVLSDPAGSVRGVVLWVDGEARDMTLQDGDCAKSCAYAATVELDASTREAGPHTYRVEVRAGARSLMLPPGAPTVGPIVLAGEDAPRILDGLSAAREIPLSFILAVGALAASAAVVTLFRRQRR